MRALISLGDTLRHMTTRHTIDKSARDFTPEQNERIRGFVRELYRRYGENQSKLAPLLGITQPALSSFISSRNGTSWAVVVKAAELLGLEPLDLIEGKDRASTDIYPNRSRAARCARALGISEEAITTVCSMRLKQNADLPAIDWLDEMRQIERRHAAGLDVFPESHIVDLDQPASESPKKGRKR